ncbi:MAG: hypothetical protein MK052_00390 [Alphaproteobacteria bacterium]|nr:hypothetical protein [Alphaproteobacteria bacterium]
MKRLVLFIPIVFLTICYPLAAFAVYYTHMIIRSDGSNLDMIHREDDKTDGFSMISNPTKRNVAKLIVSDVEYFNGSVVQTPGPGVDMYQDALAVAWKGSLTIIIPYKDSKHYLLAKHLEEYTSTDANDVFYANRQSNIIDVKGGNDLVYAGAGNDYVTLGTGSNSADGGSGTDTAFYMYAQNVYRVRRDGNSIYVQSHDGGVSSNDNLQNFEFLEFGDGQKIATESIQ